MRGTAWLFAAATMAVASPATAQGVRVALGEEATFALERDGKPGGVTRSAATADAFEMAAGRQLSGQKPPAAPVAEGTPIDDSSGLPDAPQPEPGKLHFRFLRVPGTDHSMLIIRNGYPAGLLYRARITVNGEAGPTDVCLVIPGKIGVEHWPFAISAIEVSAFELVAWKPGDAVPCK